MAILAPHPLAAQTKASAESPPCGQEVVLPRVLKTSLCVIGSTLERPLHPIVRHVAPGGGLGAGIEFDAVIHRRWHATGRAIVTAREYWNAELGAGYRDGRAHLEVYARLRDMTRLGFFGLGAESDVADQTNFRLRERVLGAMASVRVAPWLRLGGRVEGWWPEVGRGRSSDRPSLEERFAEPDAPGLTEQPRHIRYETSLDIHLPAGVGEAFYQGAKYRVAYAIFSDGELHQFSFRRLDLEAQQRFSLLGAHRRLTLHGWVSLTDTDPGQEAPFYAQHTLGGQWNLRTVHEQSIGSDGTHATLRGFRNLRFRGRNVLLLQAEYRIPVWGPVDVTVFADAGKVTSRREDLDLQQLKHNTGFSVSLMRGPATAARVDVGLGGEEGWKLWLTISRDAIP